MYTYYTSWCMKFLYTILPNPDLLSTTVVSIIIYLEKYITINVNTINEIILLHSHKLYVLVDFFCKQIVFNIL